jgi:D-sedoheptulose 7-phosphate isomerase
MAHYPLFDKDLHFAICPWSNRCFRGDMPRIAVAQANGNSRLPGAPVPNSILPRETFTPCPEFATAYFETLSRVWREHDWTNVSLLADALRECWCKNRQVFLCGNGGSAANAIHLANDYLYGIDKKTGRGLRVTALPANAAVLTCLANDIAYEDVFAQQLEVLGAPGDILIALSGSGNSPNIVKALQMAHELKLQTFAILGFTGGRALDLADYPIHFAVDDMQVAEDLQMMIGHMMMQCLSRSPRQGCP